MFKQIIIPLLRMSFVFYKPILRIIAEKIQQIESSAHKLIASISAILLKLIINLLNLWRGDEVKHWSINENHRRLVYSMQNAGTFPYIISMAWIEGVLRYKLGLTSQRTLPISIGYQQQTQGFIASQQPHGLAQYETKRSSSKFDLLAEIWLGADNFTGYIIGMSSKDANGGDHACAFIKDGNHGYVLLPNAALYSFTTLLNFYECFSKDPAFEEIMESPFDLKVESFRWDNTNKQAPSILRCISAASLEQVIKLYNAFRNTNVKHWSTRELEDDTHSCLIHSINNTTGVCTGMSMTWIEGILKYNLPITSRPSLYISVLYQDLLRNVSYEETQGIAQYTSKSSLSRFDLLFEIWLDADNRKSTGYILSMFSADDDGIGHSCAFIKDGRQGYIMLPNVGLYSFTSLLSFNECFLKDSSFRRMEERPYFIVAESYKW